LLLLCLYRKNQGNNDDNNNNDNVVSLSLGLPKEIGWVFDSLKMKPQDGKSYCLTPFKEGDEQYKRVSELFCELDGDKIPILKIYGVYSPRLVNMFLGFKSILEDRFENMEKLFVKKTWCEKDGSGMRQYTLEKFSMFSSRFSWNKTSSVNIIPLLHGTDFEIAKSICSRGFAALSTLDAGWYGQGIYFSSSARYIVPYYATKKTPCIIISYVIPGNPFPVIEDYRKDGSLLGKAITPGYQSHYVITTIHGVPVEKPSGNSFDELVISQEAQVVPAFLVIVDKTKIQELLLQFSRDIQTKEKIK